MYINKDIRQRLFEMDKNTVLSLLFDRTDKDNPKLIKASYFPKTELDSYNSNEVIISWNYVSISAQKDKEDVKIDREKEHYINQHEELLEQEKAYSNPYKEYELDWKVYWIVENIRLYHKDKLLNTFIKNAQIWMDTAFNQIVSNQLYNQVVLEHWCVWDCARQDLQNFEIWIKDVPIWTYYEDDWYGLPSYTVLLSKDDIAEDKPNEELYNLIRQRLLKAYNRILNIIEYKYKHLDLPAWPWWYAKLNKEEESFMSHYLWLDNTGNNEYIWYNDVYDASKI